MHHVKMTRSIQFRGRSLDEGETYVVTPDEHKELATYGSHVPVPAPKPAAEPLPDEPAREVASAAPETETAAAPTTRSRRAKA